MTVTFNTAGVTFNGRQKYLSQAARYGIQYIRLQRDAANPYDTHAIEIWATICNREVQLGFIPKQLAATLAPIMDSGGCVRVTAWQLCGGTENYSYGLRIYAEYFYPDPKRTQNLLHNYNTWAITNG